MSAPLRALLCCFFVPSINVRRTQPTRCLNGSLAALAAAVSLLGWTAVSLADAPAAADAVASATPLFEEGSASEKPRLTIALLDTLINPYDSFYIRETALYLEDALPQYRWQVVTISAAEALEDIEKVHPDFLFAPSSFAVRAAADESISAFRIATRKTQRAQSAAASVGSAFVVRKDCAAASLAGMRGLRAGASLPTSVDGWLAAAGEIEAAGFDPDDFFEHVDFRNNAYPDVVASLFARKIDVAVLPACLLETLEEQGLIDDSAFTVINRKNGGLACRHSTELYPDVSLLALSRAPESAVRDVTIAILSRPAAADGFEWQTNVSFAALQALLRRLQTGPYAYLKDMSPAALAKRWRSEILLASAALLLLLLNEWRLHVLVRRRTAELRAAVERQKRTAQEAAAIRTILAHYEKRSLVQQMSGMIAHEVNAPIGAIRTYALLLKMAMTGRNQAAAGSPGPAQEALAGIEHEAVRIADIVAKVRSYAKRSDAKHRPCSLEKILNKSIKAAGDEIPAEAHIEITSIMTPGLIVDGDPLELEILFLNLLRNAAAAARRWADKSKRREAVVAMRCFQQTGSRGLKRICVAIENPTTDASAATVDMLNRQLSGLAAAISLDTLSQDSGNADHSAKSSGLGLGLSICRGIADSHCASLRAEAVDDPNSPRLRITVSFSGGAPSPQEQP